VAAQAVSDLVRKTLAGHRTWVDREGQEKQMILGDIVIITPYNAQVFEIEQRLPGARVGTVDKFQGQEAPIAIYSTATSSHADAPRGLAAEPMAGLPGTQRCGAHSTAVATTFVLQRTLLADHATLVPGVVLPRRNGRFGGHGLLRRSRPRPPQRRIAVDRPGSIFRKGADVPKNEPARGRGARLKVGTFYPGGAR
jgi:hypothetical protein